MDFVSTQLEIKAVVHLVFSVYFDYNATTPLEPEVLQSISTALKDAWGNPSSSREAGELFSTLQVYVYERVPVSVELEIEIDFCRKHSRQNNLHRFKM